MLPRLKLDNIVRRNNYRLTGLRISPRLFGPLNNFKGAKTRQGHPLTFFHGSCQIGKYIIESHFSPNLGHASGFCYCCDKFTFIHFFLTSSPLISPDLYPVYPGLKSNNKDDCICSRYGRKNNCQIYLFFPRYFYLGAHTKDNYLEIPINCVT